MPLVASLVVWLAAGCTTVKQTRDLENQVSSLQTRLDALEARLEPLLPPSMEEEMASNALLESVLTATQELRWDDARAQLGTISADYPKTQAAQIAENLAFEISVVGREAAELEVERWFQGSAADLEGTKATLYVFWEAWCPHCKREVPKLSATYDQFRDQGLGVVGLTQLTRDVTPEQVTAFIEDNDVSYPIAKEQDEALAQQYGIRGIPAAALVADGEVVWRGHPGWITDDLLTKVLTR